MATKKYIELNSQFRNRNLYPNPADFQVNLSNSGIRNQINALDPISDSYPIITFNGWDILQCDYNTPDSEEPSIINLSTNFIFVVATDDSVTKLDNYYVGCSIAGDKKDTGSRRIISIKYLYNANSKNYYQITIDTPFAMFDSTLNIYNASDFSANDYCYLFIPSAMSLQNYLTGYTIYNRTQQDYVKIVSYDAVTHLAGFLNPEKEWLPTDWFYISKNPPLKYGINPRINSVKSFKRFSAGSGYPYQAVDISTNNYSQLNDPTNIKVGWNYAIDGGLPETLYINFGGYSTPSILLDNIRISGSGNEDALYTITEVYPINGTIVLDFEVDKTYINSFVGVVYNNSCTIYKIIGIDSGNVIFLDDANFTYPSTTLSDIFLEFYPYTTDNVSPLVYTGSTISQTQSSAHNVSLISLVLPNQILNPGTNAYTYPFLYVELENVCTSSLNAKNLIYSNNPNAYKAVFRVTINELYNPNTLLFIRCNAIDMPQMILFKQNTDLRIAIRLPNGELFNVKQQDYSKGAPPNEFLQISAIFSIEKI